LLALSEARQFAWEETENEIRNRIKDPGDFQPDSFRRIQLQHTGKPVFAIIGRLKGETTTTIQALRFPKDQWSVGDAKAWAAAHPMSELLPGEVSGMEFAAKTDNGEEYTSDDYLVVPDPDLPSTWKLRIREYVGGTKQITQAQLGRAAAALSPGGFRGQPVQLTPEQRRSAISKLRGMYAAQGVKPEDMPAQIRAREEGLMGLASAAGECRLLLDLAPYKASEPPDWIQVVPAPGTWQHPRYGEIKITSQILKEFKANFDRTVYQEHIPIDAEHETKASGALGYYKEVKVGGPDGEGGLWARVDWTDRGEELLKTERFKYFSPEWFDEWKDPATGQVFKNVLIGGALTTRPFFKDQALKPLVASDGFLWEVSLDDGGNEDWVELKQGSLDPADVHEDKLVVIHRKRGSLLSTKYTEDQLTELVDERVAEATKTFKDELEKAKTAAETYKAAAEESKKGLETATGRIAELESQALHRAFTDLILGRDPSADGAPPFVGEPKSHMDMMLLIAEAKGIGPELKAYVDQQRAHAKQLKEAGLFKEIGTSGGETPASVKEEFEQAAKAAMEANAKLTYAEAVQKIATEQPGLYDRYDREITGRKFSFSG